MLCSGNDLMTLKSPSQKASSALNGQLMMKNGGVGASRSVFVCSAPNSPNFAFPKPASPHSIFAPLTRSIHALLPVLELRDRCDALFLKCVPSNFSQIAPKATNSSANMAILRCRRTKDNYYWLIPRLEKHENEFSKVMLLFPVFKPNCFTFSVH